MTIRVVLVDDQEMIRAGFRMILESRPEIEVVGEADDGDTALELLETVRADVVLMDVRMPRMSGVEATRRICAGDGPRVLILTTFDLDEYAYDALRVGASGFLVKDAPLNDLVSAITHVHLGDAVVAPSTTRRLLDRFASDPPVARERRPVPEGHRLEELTPREHEVLRLVARGLSNAEIARELVLSEGTVKTHVGRILAKLGLRDRVQAVVLAYETGLVEAGDR
ncbi:response regulator [Rubrobacter tropicus]|uniref:Response regulator n=1 Tax=Rubrobacter tropicus TaxID=2653851 RepID=A0A6G8QDV6_9ACTN|nr:response regulator transcription factor [Rubrobacter tropicus]QIN84581.1 response regulator [Rubrobacter tropicus]